MLQQVDTFDDLDKLAEKLSDLLVRGPLYRVFTYKGKSCHSTNYQAMTPTRFGVLPAELKMVCSDDACRQETWWAVENGRVYFDGEFISVRRYRCKNCGVQSTYYCLIWQEHKEQNIFIKVGQYPELEERVAQDLKQALDQQDLKFYKNALRMRNFNLGLAATAYMRRVVENRMNDMLQILHETAITHNASPELLEQFQEIKAEKRFMVKVDYAGKLLPAYLRPPGHPNPMQILHELTSDGLHAKTDEECVEIFDACRKSFEFVFGRLRLEAEEAKAFVKGVAGLSERRTKAREDK